MLNYIAQLFQGMIISPRYCSIWLLMYISLYGSFSGAHIELTSFILTMKLFMHIPIFTFVYCITNVFYKKVSASKSCGMGVLEAMCHIHY